MHYGLPRAERYVSAKDVLDGKVDPALIDGNIILVGSSAGGLKDLRATPLDPAAPGVEVHAQALEQILSGDFLERPDWAADLETLVAILGALLLALLVPRAGAAMGAIAGGVMLGVAIGGSWFAFRHLGLLFDPVYPSFVVIMTYALASLLGYLQTEAQQRHIRNSFSLYLSPEMVSQVAARPELLRLGGEMRELTVMFCDIRGFTTIAEGLDAQHLTRLINRFLTPMTDIVRAHRGTIDKYIGDCIMAFWNAPLDDPEHAKNAVRGAQEMRRRLAVLNANWKAEAEAADEIFHPIHIGIGLNTGECCVGNMGSEQRLAYSALGDTVNLASRLEGLSKQYGVDFVLNESTVDQLGPGTPLIELDLVRVKGKKHAVRIYTILSDETDDRAVIERHRKFLEAYRSQDWAAARRILESTHGTAGELTALYALYERRIAEFEHASLPADWDGVYVALEK
jgi:adenylate cyclase